MPAIQKPNSELLAELDRLTAAEVADTSEAGRLNGAKVMLFKNDITPSGTTVKADLTPAAFTGYALSSAIVWGAAYLNSLKNAEIVGGTKQFVCSADGDPETIYGYAVISADGNTLRYAQRFDTPQVIEKAGDAIVIVPRLVHGRL